MDNATSVIKLLNFFEKFRELCKQREPNHRLIDIIKDVLVCKDEDEVFSVYPMILNQVRFAFDYLEKNTRHSQASLKRVRSTIESSINISRSQLYKTLSANNQDPKKYPIYLDQVIFELFESFSNGLTFEEENISQEDLDKLIKEIEDLIKNLENKNINFGDKLYLQNLLKKMILTLRNYDKFSLSDDLSGDSLALMYNVSLNKELQKDEKITNKVKNIIGSICNKVKPDKLQLSAKANIKGFLEISANGEWNNK